MTNATAGDNIASTTGIESTGADPTGADPTSADSTSAGRRARRTGLPAWLSWKRMVPLTVLALLLYYALNVWLVIRAGQVDEAQDVDAIVVLGAAQYWGEASPLLAARLDHAIDLYEAGLSEHVMVTGGRMEGDMYTEAEAATRYLIERGVPQSAILSEDAGTNTFNSLAGAAAVLLQNNLNSVLLVTDPFHARRSELIAREVGLEAYSSPTPTSVVTGSREFQRQLIEAGGVAAGRLIGFERLTALTG